MGKSKEAFSQNNKNERKLDEQIIDLFEQQLRTRDEIIDSLIKTQEKKNLVIKWLVWLLISMMGSAAIYGTIQIKSNRNETKKGIVEGCSNTIVANNNLNNKSKITINDKNINNK